MKRFLCSGLLILAIGTQLCANTDSGKTIIPHLSGFASYEYGQIANGQSLYRSLSNASLSKATIGLFIDAEPTQWSQIIVGGEGEIAYSFLVDEYYPDLRTTVTRQPRFSFALRQGEGIARYGDTTRVGGMVEIGYFPFKYNSQVKNLGEYLFRSRVYPNYLDNAFDFASARLLGLHYNIIALSDLKANILFTSEVNRFPLQDFSLSVLAQYSGKKGIEVGAGCMMERILSVDRSLTTPQHGTNRYLENSDTTRFQSIDTISDPPVSRDSIYVVGDTGYYSFSGTKLVGHIVVDPKALLKLAGVDMPIFGEEDLKIYSEVAVLGLTNFPKYYENIKHRIPFMVGFNIPAFKVLDVLALELEFWDNPYPNSYERIFRTGDPLPGAEIGSTRAIHQKNSWSVYAKKTLSKHFSITAQCARDHLQPLSLAIDKLETFDVLQEKKDFWWTLKLKAEF